MSSLTLKFEEEGEVYFHNFNFTDTINDIFLKVAHFDGVRVKTISFEDKDLTEDFETEIQFTELCESSQLLVSHRFTRKELELHMKHKHLKPYEKKDDTSDLYSVTKNGLNLMFIEDQSTEMCLIAVQKNPFSLIYVKNPTSEIILAAIKKNYKILEYIKHLSRKIQLISIMIDYRSIKFFDVQTEEMCIAAVEKHCNALKYINNPSEKVCMIAIRYDHTSINFIKNPTDRIKRYAAKRKRKYEKYSEKDVFRACMYGNYRGSLAYVLINSLDTKGFGCSPLLYAAEKGHVDIVNNLRRKGVNLLHDETQLRDAMLKRALRKCKTRSIISLARCKLITDYDSLSAEYKKIPRDRPDIDYLFEILCYFQTNIQVEPEVSKSLSIRRATIIAAISATSLVASLCKREEDIRNFHSLTEHEKVMDLLQVILERESFKDIKNYFEWRKVSNVNLACENGIFLLSYASMNNKVEACKYLISKGASLSVIDNFGVTLIESVFLFGSKEMKDFYSKLMMDNIDTWPLIP